MPTIPHKPKVTLQEHHTSFPAPHHLSQPPQVAKGASLFVGTSLYEADTQLHIMEVFLCELCSTCLEICSLHTFIRN